MAEIPSVVRVEYVGLSEQSIPDNISTIVLFNGTKIIDTHSAYNTTTGIFTAPISGYYDFDVSGLLDSLSTASTDNNTLIKNITQNKNYQKYFSHPAIRFMNLDIKRTIQLNAGDQVGFYVSHTCGGNRSLLTSPNYSRIAITWIGK